MKLIPRLAACVAAMFFTLPAVAQEGDAEKGRLKVYTCTGCHGIEGYRNIYPHYHVPKIGGQNYEYLVIALTAYQKGDRKHPTMQAQAESFTAEDIADISRYLSGVGNNEQ